MNLPRPISRTQPICLHLCALFFGLTLPLLASCGRSASAPATRGSIDVYDLRGTVESLPTPAAPHTLSIRHESTPDMESMTMSFDVDEAIGLQSLAVGDKIAFRYEINWPERRNHVTRIDKLPPDTVLNFGPVAPAKSRP